MLAQIASLVITAVLIWNSAVRPRLMFEQPSAILAHALLFATLAWFFAAVITATLYLFLPGADSRDMVWNTFRTAGVAVWFAPACILLSQLSPATLIAALLLTITATRLLFLNGAPDARPRPSLGQPLRRRGCSARGPSFGRCSRANFAPAWRGRGFAGRSGFGLDTPAVSRGRRFVLSASIVTLFAMVSGAVRTSSTHLAALRLWHGHGGPAGFGVDGGRPRVARGGGDGEGLPGSASGKGAVASAKEILRDLFGDEEPAPGEKSPGAVPSCRRPPASLPTAAFPGRHPVARSEAGHADCRAASQGFRPEWPWPVLTASPSRANISFRFPQLRPPPTSILQRGSPATLAFSTVDRRPLNMDAIQKLDEPIDLSCCRTLRVEIWNADKYSGTVALELYANDTSLGVLPVRSTPDLQREPLVAVMESLDFPIASP